MARSLQILRGIFYLQPFNTHSNAMEEKNMTTANVERERKKQASNELNLHLQFGVN